MSNDLPIPVPREHRMQRPRALDLEEPTFGFDPAYRGEPSRLASSRKHTMTRHDDGGGIAAEGLPDDTRETHVSEADGDLTVGESLAGGNRTCFDVHAT